MALQVHKWNLKSAKLDDVLELSRQLEFILALFEHTRLHLNSGNQLVGHSCIYAKLGDVAVVDPSGFEHVSKGEFSFAPQEELGEVLVDEQIEHI